MRYDQMGLKVMILKDRPTYMVGQEPPSFNFAKAAATAAGILVFLGLGLAATVLVGILKGPLWALGTAVALGGGFYIWRAYQQAEYKKYYGT